MKTIGMILPTPDNSFFASLAAYVSEKADQEGWKLLLCSSDNNAEKEKEQLKLFETYGIDGILCISGLSELPSDLFEKEIPIVWIDRVPHTDHPIPWAANDDRSALKEATSYLIHKGCRDIMLAPGFVAEGNDSPRISGYRDALEENSIPFDPSRILKRPGLTSSEKETEQLVRERLREGCAIDGIITSSDRAAFGAMAALRSIGYYVPEDVRLITFDNSPYASAGITPITALERNSKQMADTACEVLGKIMNGQPAPYENIIPVSLVERESTR